MEEKNGRDRGNEQGIKMLPEQAICKDCQLGQSPNIDRIKVNCMGYIGHENPSIIFIGEAPGGDEDSIGRPFIGKSGMMLRWLVRRALKEGDYPCTAGFDHDPTYMKSEVANLEEEYGIINAVRCRPTQLQPSKYKKDNLGNPLMVVKDKKPTARNFKTCIKYNVAEIDKRKPKMIILLGGLPFEAMTQRTGILKNRGSIYPWICSDGTEIPMLATVHPSYIARTPTEEEYTQFVLEIRTALDVVYFDKDVSRKLPPEPYYIYNIEWVEWLFTTINQQEIIAVDIETNDTWADDVPSIPYRAGASIVGISFCWNENDSAFLPFDHPQSPWRTPNAKPSYMRFVEETLTPIDESWALQARNYILYKLKEFLENPKIKKLAHNGKFDFEYIEVLWGIHTANFYMDTMLISHSLDERRGIHGLKYLANKHAEMSDYERELSDKFKVFRLLKDRHLWNIDIPTISKYGGWDAVATYRLYKVFESKIKQEITVTNYGESISIEKLMNNFIMKVAQTTMDMEITGTYINKTQLEQSYLTINGRMESLDAQMHALPDVRSFEEWVYQERIKENPNKPPPKYQINFGAVAQLGRLLYDWIKLPPKLTEKGNYSITADILAEFNTKMENPPAIIPMLIEYRKLKHIRDTYISPYRDGLLLDSNSRVHTNFLLHGTVTGRLSSRNPNLQNIPRGTTASEIKSFFSASPGCVLINADYSQIELRVLALYSGDKLMLEAYKKGEDLHAYVSSLLFGIPIRQVEKPIRQIGKTLNFGLVYGMGSHKLGIEFRNLLNDETLKMENIRRAYKAADSKYSEVINEKPWLKGFYQRDWLKTGEIWKNDGADYDTQKKVGELAKLVSVLHKMTFEGINKFGGRQILKAIRDGYVSTLFGRKRRLSILKEELERTLDWAEWAWNEDSNTRQQRMDRYNKDSENYNKIINGMVWYKNKITTKLEIIEYQDKEEWCIRFIDKKIKPTYANLHTLPDGAKYEFAEGDLVKQLWDGKYNQYDIAEAMRHALNAPIQGSASDICLYSIIRLSNILRERGYKAKVVLTVHDSIIIDCPQNESVDVMGLTKLIMEDLDVGHEYAPINLNWLYDDKGYKLCPILADIEFGANWLNMEEWIYDN